MTAHGLDQLARHATLSFEHGVAKPSPEIFQRALASLDAQPAGTLMVGDHPLADGGAAALEIRTLILPMSQPKRTDLPSFSESEPLHGHASNLAAAAAFCHSLHVSNSGLQLRAAVPDDAERLGRAVAEGFHSYRVFAPDGWTPRPACAEIEQFLTSHTVTGRARAPHQSLHLNHAGSVYLHRPLQQYRSFQRSKRAGTCTAKARQETFFLAEFLRRRLCWLYGQGFPKSLNVAVAIDRAEGHPPRGRAIPVASTHFPNGRYAKEKLTTNPVERYRPRSRTAMPCEQGNYDAPGRWPANVGLSHTEDCRQVGHTRVRSNGHHPAVRRTGGLGTTGHKGQDGLAERISAGELIDCWECSPHCPVRLLDERSGDIGGASRFFYCAKASRSERNAGLDGFSKAVTDDGRQTPNDTPYQRGKTTRQNVHPTVKPIELMRWLVRLATPPGGLVLDPFAGSGSTGAAAVTEGARFIGIEREAEYVPIARARIRHWARRSRDGSGRKAG